MKQYVVYMPQFDSLIQTALADGFKVYDMVLLETQGGIKLGTGIVVGEL